MDVSNHEPEQAPVASKRKKRVRSVPPGRSFRMVSVGKPVDKGPVIHLHPRRQDYQTKKDPRTGRSRSRTQHEPALDLPDHSDGISMPGMAWGHRPLPPPRVTDDQRWQELRPSLFQQSLRHGGTVRNKIAERCCRWVSQHCQPFTPCSACQLRKQRVLFVQAEACFTARVPYYSCGCVTVHLNWGPAHSHVVAPLAILVQAAWPNCRVVSPAHTATAAAAAAAHRV